MKLSEIREQLRKDGFFIYRKGTLYVLGQRTGDDYKLFTDNIPYLSLKERLELSPVRYLLLQCQQQLLDPTETITDLSSVIPKIDFGVFEDYDARNNEIERHKALIDKITKSKSIFGRKKFKLVKVEKHNHMLQDDEQINYYVIKDNEVVPIDETLLDNPEDAVKVRYISDLRKALKDDFVNQYQEFYDKEVAKWVSLE